MTNDTLPPHLEAIGRQLTAAARDLALSARRDLSTPSEPVRSRVPRSRPRLLASGTLGLAGVGVALVLALSGSAASPAPAFAVTRQHDGSVLVQIKEYPGPGVSGAEHKLAAMGIHEFFEPRTATGAATVSGPVTCTPAPGGSNPSGPQVKVLLGTDGTGVIPSGNSGAGTWHLTACYLYNGETPAGNTGAASAG